MAQQRRPRGRLHDVLTLTIVLGQLVREPSPSFHAATCTLDRPQVLGHACGIHTWDAQAPTGAPTVEYILWVPLQIPFQKL